MSSCRPLTTSCGACVRASALGWLPAVQFTTLLALRHPLSVDLYVERTLRSARSLCCGCSAARVTGPMASRACARCLKRGALFACLPGELSFDPARAARSMKRDRASSGAISASGADNFVQPCNLPRISSVAPIRPPTRPMPAAGFWPVEPRAMAGLSCRSCLSRACGLG